MTPSAFFRHCPRCGLEQPGPTPSDVFECRACRFRYYFSAAVAVAVFVRRRDDGRALFIRRAREPAAGKLAPPGGFIDVGETAETAAPREIREEVGLEIEGLEFLCSQPNLYPFGEIDYPVLDFFFTAHALRVETTVARDEVAEVEWLDPLAAVPADMAFPSMKQALELWQSTLRNAD